MLPTFCFPGSSTRTSTANQGVHRGCTAAGACDDHGFAVRLLEEIFDVQVGWLMVPRPGLVLPTQVAHEGVAFWAHWPVLSQIPRNSGSPSAWRQTLCSSILCTRRHPGWFTKFSLGVVRRWELPLVPGENQTRYFAGCPPHLVQAAEVLLEQLGGLVDDDEIVAHHHPHGLYQGLVEQEGPMTGAQISLRMSILWCEWWR